MMTIVVVLLVLVLIAVVVWVVGAPLRRRGSGAVALDVHRDELEAAKEAKYRELRDLELDYRTGKLSDEDYATLDRTLRAEAVEILRRLDELE
jgi:hypothetical protein